VKAIAVSVLLVAGLVACDREDPALTREGSASLSAQVSDARRAAATGDYEGATQLLDAVDGIVADLRRTDEISDARADDVRVAVGDAREAVAQYAATTTTTTTTTTQPERDEDDDDRGRDNQQDESGDD
jgi:hypothetical protein